MDTTPFIVLSLVAAVIGLQLLFRYKALQSKGKSVTPLQEAIPRLDTKAPGLVYCFSPNCGPCKSMLPAINELASEHKNIHKLDISKNLELAKDIGIRATPTTLLIENGEVSQVLLGAKSLNSLRKALDQQS
jgi:thioredoxin 1